jgi:hypothetical protein
MSLTNIKGALVSAYVAGAFGLPTAHENKIFKPVTGTPWASLFVVPNQPSVGTLGDAGEDNHDGFLQIDLNYPLNKGDGEALSKSDEMRDYFKAGSRHVHSGQVVTVTNCGRSIGRQVDGWYRITLTINWYARTAR